VYTPQEIIVCTECEGEKKCTLRSHWLCISWTE